MKKKSYIVIKLFQFLIGRLVTKVETGKKGDLIVFQFLIGRLVTACWLEPSEVDKGFQFLIGRLVTKHF